MIDTKQMAKEIWSIDNLDSKKALIHKMIDALHAKTETKNRFRNDVDRCKSMNKIDKLAADLTLVGYNMKAI